MQRHSRNDPNSTRLSIRGQGNSSLRVNKGRRVSRRAVHRQPRHDVDAWFIRGERELLIGTRPRQCFSIFILVCDAVEKHERGEKKEEKKRNETKQNCGARGNRLGFFPVICCVCCVLLMGTVLCGGCFWAEMSSEKRIVPQASSLQEPTVSNRILCPRAKTTRYKRLPTKNAPSFGFSGPSQSLIHSPKFKLQALHATHARQRRIAGGAPPLHTCTLSKWQGLVFAKNLVLVVRTIQLARCILLLRCPRLGYFRVTRTPIKTHFQVTS